jgi:hypothetical protein
LRGLVLRWAHLPGALWVQWLSDLMFTCWQNDPAARPTFAAITDVFRRERILT